MIEKGQTAPDFSTPDQDNKDIKLSDYKGKNNAVLYFYPKDDTPGCTIEANDFTALSEEFSKLDTLIFGVSMDSCDSHQAFIKKFNLKIKLLADTDGELCRNYFVWQEKEKDGIKKMGIVRSTFIIDKEGKIAEAMYSVNPQGHAQEILDKIKKINS